MSSLHKKKRRPPVYLRWLLFASYEYGTWEFCQRRERQLRYHAPIRYWVVHDVPMGFRILKRRLDDAKWWVKHRTTHKNHIINTKLSPGWINSSDRIIHATFETACRYVWHEFLEEKWKEYSGIPSPYRRCRVIFDDIIEDMNNGNGRPYRGPETEFGILFDMYLWWVYEFPQRFDPYSTYQDENSSPPTKQKTKKWYGQWFVPTTTNDDDLFFSPTRHDELLDSIDELYTSQLFDNYTSLASVVKLIE